MQDVLALQASTRRLRSGFGLVQLEWFVVGGDGGWLGFVAQRLSTRIRQQVACPEEGMIGSNSRLEMRSSDARFSFGVNLTSHGQLYAAPPGIGCGRAGQFQRKLARQIDRGLTGRTPTAQQHCAGTRSHHATNGEKDLIAGATIAQPVGSGRVVTGDDHLCGRVPRKGQPLAERASRLAAIQLHGGPRIRSR